MQRKRIFKKAISVICALAMLLTAVYQPGWAVRSEAAKPMETTETLTELTWDDFYRTDGETWVKGSVVDNLRSDTDLSNTLFNDEIWFGSDNQYIRYGGANRQEWYAPLQIGINNEGKLYVSNADGFFTHTPNNSTKTYDASYFGLPTFINVPLNLKISVTNMSEDRKSADVCVWINDQIVGSEFTIKSNGYTIGSNIVSTGNIKREDNTLPPSNLTELTWDSYVKTEEGNTIWVKGSVANNLHSDTDLSNTLFNDEIWFGSDNQYIRYGGANRQEWYAPLQIGINNEGKLYVSNADGFFTHTPNNSTKTYDASYFGLPTFINVPLNLKISMTNMGEDKKSATVSVWINDQIVGSEFTVRSDSPVIGSNIVCSGINVKREDNTLPPSNLTELTWDDFYRTDAQAWVKGSVAQNLRSTKEMSNTLFNDEIKFNINGNYIRYGGSNDFRENAPLEIGVNEDKLYVNAGSGTGFTASSTFSYDASYFGLPTFLEVPLNLKISVTNMSEDKTSATVSVWINDQIVGNAFTVSSSSYTIGSNIMSNGFVKREDNTLPPVISTEPEIKKITWENFGVTAETTYKDRMTELSYDGATLNNTEFEGDVTFSAKSELRYGGLNGDQGLQISVDGSGRFRIVEGTYTVAPIGGWSWPENPYSEKVYTPEELGITEYESFAGQRITLRIKMEEVTDTTAKVTIHINDKVVGGAFRMTSTGAKTGTKIGMCGNGYGEGYIPVTAHVAEPVVTNISWNDFSGVKYGVPYTTWTNYTYSEASLQYTELTGRVMFAAGGVLRIGGDAGLHIGAKTDGKLYVSSHTFGRYDYKTGESWTYDEEPKTYGIDTFVNTPVDLKVRIGKISEDKKTVEQVKLYINGVQVGNAFSMRASGDTPIGNQLSLCCNDYGYNDVTILSDEAVPEGLTSVTWEDFGITGSYKYNRPNPDDTVRPRTAHHFENLNNTLFNGDLKMEAGAHFRYGCSSGAWSGLQFTVNADGSLKIDSDTFNWDAKGNYATFAATQFGMENFKDTRFNLKIAMTDVTTTTATVGVWINNQMAGTYFTMTSGNAEVFKLGTTIWWATTTSYIVPYSNGRAYDADKLTSIRLTDWPTYSGEEIGTELTHYEINGSENRNVDSLVDTSFCETIKFVGPTPNTNDAYMFCYGGEKGTDMSWHGLRIALVGDQMVLYSGVGSFTEYWYLDAQTAGIAAFTNTEYQLRIDVVRLGKHALVYMYFDGVLYNNAPFVLEDFADKMSNTLVFRAEVTDATPYAILGASEKNLFDLYHDLGVKEGETSGYVLPNGLTSAKKVEGSNENALSASGGETIDQAGIYQIEFDDGVSKYSQKVYLYQAGDSNQNNKWDATDLVQMKKQMQEGSPAPSGIDEKTKDVNKDGIVNADDVTAIRKRIIGSYQADSSEVMPVVGFHGPIDNSDGTEGTASMNTVKQEVYDMIQDLGINTIVQYQNQYTDVASDRYEVYQQLTLAQNIGVKMTVQDYRLYTKAETATKEDVENAIANYENYQSFAGLYLTDEPRSDSYPPKNTGTNTISYFSSLAKAAKQAGVWTYSNAKPYMYREVNNKSASYQYKNYLTEYMNEFDLNFLSSTYYPFFTYEINKGGVGDGVEDAAQYFENLALASTVAENYNVPFWRIVQSGDGFEMSEREPGNPSKGEFKWNVNTSLAFGAKGITYFQLVQDKTSYDVSGLTTTSGLIGAKGEKNEWYDYAKEANAQIQAVDDVLMNATYQGFMVDGTYATNATAGVDSMKLYSKKYSLTVTETLSLKKSESYNGATVTSGDTSYGAVTGCFTTQDGKNAMYVVNYDVSGANTVTVDFGSQKNVTYVQNAVTKTEDVQTLQLNLAAGDAALIIFK